MCSPLRPLRPLRFILFAFLVPVAVKGQEQARDTAQAETVVVTATRATLERGQLPVAVTVLDGDALRARGIATVADALREVTSAYIARAGSQGATTSLFLRGGQSNYVKVLVDGVPVNEPGGAFDFASLTTDNVERIEVVRGPASVVHGSDAATGVVHVITRRGSGEASVETDVRVGTAPRQTLVAGPAKSTRSLDASVVTRGGMGPFGYALTVANHTTNGLYQFNNDFRNTVVSGRFDLRPTDRTELRLSTRLTDYEYQYPTNGAGEPVDSNALRAEERLSIGVELEQRLTTTARAVLALTSSVNDGGTHDESNPGDPSSGSYVSNDRSRRRGVELLVHALPTTHAAVTIGALVEHQDLRSVSESEFPPFPASSTSFDESRRNLAGYTEFVLTPRADLTATLGARLDDNQRFGTFQTARGGVSWTPAPGTRFRASAGNAFREPSFIENYSTAFTTGNPELRPEHTVGADLGVEQDIPSLRATVALTAFANRFRDLIDYDWTESACGYSYCNVALATSRGLEGEGHARVGTHWTASVGATLLRTRVEEPGYDSASGGLFERGQRLLRRPELSWNAGVVYERRAWSASGRVIGVGERDDRFFGDAGAERTTLPAYHLVELAAEFRLAPRTSTTFRVENLGDVRYQSVHGFLAPRRTMYVGVRVHN